MVIHSVEIFVQQICCVRPRPVCQARKQPCRRLQIGRGQRDILLLHEQAQLQHHRVPRCKRCAHLRRMAGDAKHDPVRKIVSAEQMIDQIGLADACLAQHKSIGVLPRPHTVAQRQKPPEHIALADESLVLLLLASVGGHVPLVHDLIVQRGGLLHRGNAEFA